MEDAEESVVDWDEVYASVVADDDKALPDVDKPMKKAKKEKQPTEEPNEDDATPDKAALKEVHARAHLHAQSYLSTTDKDQGHD